MCVSLSRGVGDPRSNPFYGISISFGCPSVCALTGLLFSPSSFYMKSPKRSVLWITGRRSPPFLYSCLCHGIRSNAEKSSKNASMIRRDHASSTRPPLFVLFLLTPHDYFEYTQCRVSRWLSCCDFDGYIKSNYNFQPDWLLRSFSSFNFFPRFSALLFF